MIKTFFYKCYISLLAWEAGLFRSRIHGPVIAITGSVGKTSAKEAIGVMVRKKFGDTCIVTPKSLNTDVGVPLTLFGYHSEPVGVLGWLFVPFRGMVIALFSPAPKCLVLELGADHKGDIARLGKLVRPTHAIITAITEAHTQSLGSLKDIEQEKTSLLRYLAPDGIALVNGDNDFLSKFPVAPTQTKVKVSIYKRADYFASGIKVTTEGTEAVLHHHNRTQRLRIRRYGEHQIYSALFAAAIADALEIPSDQQLAAFKEIKPVAGRGMLLDGKKGALLLDESYNGYSMDRALETLALIPAKKRIAILGDMRELKDPESKHLEIGKLARQVADYTIAVGPMSRGYKANEWFLTAEEAVPSALRQCGPGVIILIKGSQNTIRLEKVVKALMLHPEKASQLLVRQGKQWEHRR